MIDVLGTIEENPERIQEGDTVKFNSGVVNTGQVRKMFRRSGDDLLLCYIVYPGHEKECNVNFRPTKVRKVVPAAQKELF